VGVWPEENKIPVVEEMFGRINKHLDDVVARKRPSASDGRARVWTPQ
jgi:hypothetical protein